MDGRNLVQAPERLSSTQVKALPVWPMERQGRISHGQIVPANVTYTSGGGLIPALPSDPDLAQALTVTTVKALKNARLSNGLTRRADIMARLIARGASQSAAYRAAYNSQQLDPIKVAHSASRIASVAVFNSQVARYRAVLEYEARQQVIGIADFVKSRLVHESQTARNDGARVQALKLLGLTEGLFTTVTRTEKTLSPKDLGALKTELNQRLRDSLLRIAPQLAALSSPTDDSLSHEAGTDRASQEPESRDGEPHPGHAPLCGEQGLPTKKDTIPVTQDAVFQQTPRVGSPSPLEAPQMGPTDMSATPLPAGAEPALAGSVGPVMMVQLGSDHREMGLEDL